MATIPRRVEEHHPDRLRNGDRMMQREFHCIYCQMAEDYHAELIAGMVFEPSPVSVSHGECATHLAHLL